MVGLPGKTVEDSFAEFSEEGRREYDKIESDMYNIFLNSENITDLIHGLSFLDMIPKTPVAWKL